MLDTTADTIPVTEADITLFRTLIGLLVRRDATDTEIMARGKAISRKAEGRSLADLLPVGGETVYIPQTHSETMSQALINALDKARTLETRCLRAERVRDNQAETIFNLRHELRAGNVLLEGSGKLDEHAGRHPRYVDRNGDADFVAFAEFKKMAIIMLGGVTQGWMSRCAEDIDMSVATIWNYRRMEFVPLSAWKALGSMRGDTAVPSIHWPDHDANLANLLAPGLTLRRKQSYFSIAKEMTDAHGMKFSESCVKMRIFRLRKMAKETPEVA